MDRMMDSRFHEGSLEQKYLIGLVFNLENASVVHGPIANLAHNTFLFNLRREVGLAGLECYGKAVRLCLWIVQVQRKQSPTRSRTAVSRQTQPSANATFGTVH